MLLKFLMCWVLDIKKDRTVVTPGDTKKKQVHAVLNIQYKVNLLSGSLDLTFEL